MSTVQPCTGCGRDLATQDHRTGCPVASAQWQEFHGGEPVQDLGEKRERFRKEAYLWCAEAIMLRCRAEAQFSDHNNAVMEIYRALKAAGQTPLTQANDGRAT